MGDPQTLPSRPHRQSSPGSVRPSSLDVATCSLVDVVLSTSKTTLNGCRIMQPQSSPIVRTASNPPTQLPLKQLHLCRTQLGPPPARRSAGPHPSYGHHGTFSTTKYFLSICLYAGHPPSCGFCLWNPFSGVWHSNGVPARHHHTYGSRPNFRSTFHGSRWPHYQRCRPQSALHSKAHHHHNQGSANRPPCPATATSSQHQPSGYPHEQACIHHELLCWPFCQASLSFSNLWSAPSQRSSAV